MGYSPALGIAALLSFLLLALLASIQQMNRGFQSSKAANPAPFKNTNCTFYDSNESPSWWRQSPQPVPEAESRVRSLSSSVEISHVHLVFHWDQLNSSQPLLIPRCKHRLCHLAQGLCSSGAWLIQLLESAWSSVPSSVHWDKGRESGSDVSQYNFCQANFCLSCQMCPPRRNNTLTPPAAAVSAAECHLLGNGWFPPWKINRSHSQWQRFLWEEALHRDKTTGSLRLLHQQQSALLSPAVPVGLDKSLHTLKPLFEAILTTPPPSFCAAVPLMPRRDSHGN